MPQLRLYTETELLKFIDRTFTDKFTKIDDLLVAILRVLQEIYKAQTGVIVAPPGEVPPVTVEPVLWKAGETYTIKVGTTSRRIRDDDVPCKGVTIKNDDHNTGIIYWGFSEGVTSETGYPLEPSQSFTIPIDNLNKVWVIATASDQKLRIAYGS
jgi:hypothetical protein